MKILKVVAALLLIAIASVSAAGAPLLREENVALRSVKGLLSDDYYVEIEDDRLKVSNGSLQIWLAFDTDRTLLRLSGFWFAVDELSEARAYKIANQFNRDKIITRAYYSIGDEQNIFFLDTYITYKGGLVKENIVEMIRWFFTLCSEFSDVLAEEDAR